MKTNTRLQITLTQYSVTVYIHKVWRSDRLEDIYAQLSLLCFKAKAEDSEMSGWQAQ